MLIFYFFFFNIFSYSTCYKAPEFEAENYRSKEISIPITKSDGVKKNIKLNYSLFFEGESFDPSKPTIVNVSGGPSDSTFHQDRPSHFSPELQVINIDYLGVNENGLSQLNGLSDSDILQNFTSDKQAEAIKEVIRKEELSNYLLWGESHGVQISIKALDQIQKDDTLIHKPKTLLLVSGMGRRISADDERIKREKGLNGPKGRCIKRDSEQEASRQREQRPTREPLYNDATIETFASNCNQPFGAIKEDLSYKINPELETEIRKSAGKRSPDEILNRIYNGTCPNFKLKNLWNFSMSCGVFEENIGVRRRPMPCYDSNLDIKNYDIGDTSILGIQSEDDCNNFVSSMDYLIDQAKEKTEKDNQIAYLKTGNGGGHVLFRNPQGSLAKCRSGNNGKSFFSKVFSSDAAGAKNILKQCEDTSIVRCYDNNHSNSSSIQGAPSADQ